MKNNDVYDPKVMMRLLETNEMEIVNMVEFTPRVSLVVDFMPGTKNYRRITLSYNIPTNDYRVEVYGRTLISSGPKPQKEPKDNVRNSFKRFKHSIDK
jgi:hypothetical protein